MDIKHVSVKWNVPKMKGLGLIMLLITLSCTAENMFSQSTDVKMAMRNTTLANRIVELHNKTSYEFSSSVSIQEITEAQQQEKTITGIIVDSYGEPIVGATVVVQGDAFNGTVTDVDGKYLLKDVPDNAILNITYVGMKPQSIPTDGRTTIDITLVEETELLDELVVVGYGEQSRRLITASISKLDNRVLENIPYTNIGTSLKGALPGVRVQSLSGQPGDAPRIIVRGGTSINNPDGANPLYVVDGVIRPDLYHINSNDIESIQVLKDASATAIYGARASNGVVIITTKTGKIDKTLIGFKYNLTTSKMNLGFKPLSARDYIYYQRLGIQRVGLRFPAELIKLDGELSVGTGNDLTNRTAYSTQYLSEENKHKLNEGWQSMPDPLDPTKTIIFADTDWQSILFRTGMSHDYNLTASGGTEKALFNLGVGYQTNEGIVKNSSYDRISLNMNGSVKPFENLTLLGRMLYSNSSTSSVSGDAVFGFAMGVAPTAKYRFEDGTLSPGPGNSSGNPDYKFQRTDIKNSNDRLTLVVGGIWEIIPSLLIFETQVSRLISAGKYRAFTKSMLTSPTTINDARNASGSYNETLQDQIDAAFSLEKSIRNIHNINAKLGYSYFKSTSSALGASGRGAATDIIPTLNASPEMVSITGSESEHVITGYFTRVNYDFDRKYLFSLTGRYDGASNLGKNNKWSFFPALSLGWNMHSESFWRSMPKEISQFKYRLSYGVNGNITGLGPYQAGGQYSVGARYDGNPAIINSIIANQNLRWEESKTFNTGIDVGFFEDRLSIIIDIYKRLTENLITGLQLPHSSGFASIATNLSTLENKGFELEIATNNVLSNSSPFVWDIAFNAALVKSKVLKLPDNGVANNRIGGIQIWDSKKNDYVWAGGIQEGLPVGNLYAYKQLGIYSTDEEAAAGPIDMLVPGNDKTKFGGDVNWYDSDGNGVIDERDRVLVGNLYPKWTGGLTNYLSYKNVDFTIRTDFMTGHTSFNYRRASTVAQFSGEQNLSEEVKRSWSKPGDITDIPRFVWADKLSANVSRGNSEYYEKGDFFAIREVTLGYLFPKNVTDRIGFNQIKFNLTAENIHYFTNYRGNLPEYGSTGTAGRYPLPFNLIFGININL